MPHGAQMASTYPLVIRYDHNELLHYFLFYFVIQSDNLAVLDVRAARQVKKMKFAYEASAPLCHLLFSVE